jgi:hypothetical protein
MADTAAASLTPPEPALVKHVGKRDRGLAKGGCACWKSSSYQRSSAEPHLRDVLYARVRSPQGDSAGKAAGITALKPNVGLMAQRRAQWLS